MANMKAYISKHNKNTLLKAHRKHLDIQLGNCTNKQQCRIDLLRLLSAKLILQETFVIVKKKFTFVYPKLHLKFALVTTEKMFTKRGHRNDTELYQIVLESKTTEGNIHYKVKIIKGTLRLQSKEKAMYIMPR